MNRLPIVLALLALAACGRPSESAESGGNGEGLPVASTDPSFYPEWSRDDVMYEINVRQYTPEGTFAALETHLPRLKELGVDILWLMPVQPIGVEGRKGSLGSYYSIADYTAVNPEHGTPADFRRFVEAAHRQGMRVILDWVANHTSRDHPWTREHRDWYTLTSDGRISFPLDQQGKETDWTDVAELNYDNPQMRRAMIGEMRWWMDSMAVDGFRFDVAWGIPYDFWAEVRPALQQSKRDVFMLAEAEDPRLHEWFHATYGWEYHHLLNQVARGEKPTSALDAYFAKQEREYGPGAYRMFFTSNHDENSWQGTEFERMGENHRAAFVVSATAANSFPLLYTGQEASLNKRLRFFEKDTVDWNGASLAPFYRTLFELKQSQPALHNGPWGGEMEPLRTTGGDRVYAYTRTRGSNTLLIAVNFGDAPVRAAFQGLEEPGTYADAFTRANLILEETGEIPIGAHGFRVLVRQ